jgi:DNA ligase-1
MEGFVKLIIGLGKTKSINEKRSLMANYFSHADDQDKLWTIALFTGKKPKKIISSSQLKAWCIELCQLPDWLFNECYHTVGDLAETISLVLPQNELFDYHHKSLSQIIQQLNFLVKESDDKKKEFITQKWQSLNREGCFVFNKLLTGGFRIGISQQIIYQAIGQAENIPTEDVSYLFSGKWHPDETTYRQLLQKENALLDASKPYPFYLAYPIETDVTQIGTPNEWIAEWKWDGIRGQCIKRKENIFVWSRGEELITEQFPEFHSFLTVLPEGTVIDGEILCADPHAIDISPLPFSRLQKRITLKKITSKIKEETPVIFIAYDLLEWEGKDVRQLPLQERKRILTDLIQNTNDKHCRLSEPVFFEDWEFLKQKRALARDISTEGIMLKRADSSYLSGRKKGDWWKWKIDPLVIDCVMIYAQKGHGRRSNLFTDYTFAVKDGDKLISFTKAYSGLTDEEFKEVDQFVKKNALEKFGPVRTVKPEMVFEIAFEGISESKRHKAGIALRFPRMKRIRKDKTVEEINTLDDLKKMLELYGT